MAGHLRATHIEIDFPTEPFHSAGRALIEGTRLYLATFPFLAVLTIAVFLPAKFVLQFALYVADVPSEGILSYVLTDFWDLVFGAVLAPATIYGLVGHIRRGQTPPIRHALGWGWQLWGRSLWNRIKVEITVGLWTLLLFVPGIVATIRLILTDPIVAIEAEGTPEVLRRSRDLTAGHGWRIFLALLPAVPISLAHMYASLRALQYSRWLMPPVDAVLSVADQWMTAVIVVIYLGVAVKRTVASPRAPQKARR